MRHNNLQGQEVNLPYSFRSSFNLSLGNMFSFPIKQFAPPFPIGVHGVPKNRRLFDNGRLVLIILI